MDLSLLNKINNNTKQYINHDLLFDIIESKRIVKVGVFIDNLNEDISLIKLPLLEKISIFQELGHNVVIVFNDYRYKDLLSEKQISERINMFLNSVSKIINTENIEVIRNSVYQQTSTFKTKCKQKQYFLGNISRLKEEQINLLVDMKENNIIIGLIEFNQKKIIEFLYNNKLINRVSTLILKPSRALVDVKLSDNLQNICKQLGKVSRKVLSDILSDYSNFSEEDQYIISQELRSSNLYVFRKAKSKVILNVLGKLFSSNIRDFSLEYLRSLQKLKVSVIIAAYNRVDFLPESINSLLKQFYKNIEIIIVDDGSVDGTKQYCKYLIRKYNNKYDIKYIYQKNRGVGSARNLGLKRAVGDLVTILDHDDYMLEDGIIDRVIPFIDNPKINIVYAKRDTLLNDNYNRIRQKHHEPYHDDGFTKLKTKEDHFLYLLKKQVTFGANTMMYRRKVLKKVGFFYEDRKFMGLEHNAFLLKIFKNYLVYFVDKVVYLMRRNHVDDHLSKKFENNTLRSEIFINKLLPKVLKELNVSRDKILWI
ncbi:MAG: glycosyltransferase family A protein [Patescibacteria group bacterium]